MMLAIKRTETIKFGDFMSGEYKTKGYKVKREMEIIQRAIEGSRFTKYKNGLKWVAGFAFAGTFATRLPMAFAAGVQEGVQPDGSIVEVAPGEVPSIPVEGALADSVKAKIVHAFDPLIELMVDISLPISGVMLTAGGLLILVGNKEAGYRLIFNAASGYVLVQLSPLFIDLLAGVGSAV